MREIEIGDRIKELRQMLHLTQQEFSDRISVKRSTIAQYEIGRNVPADSVIALICREYGVSEAWLRTGEGDMFVPQAETLVDQLAEKYHLTPPVRLLVEKFVLLPEDKQEAVIEFITDFAADLQAGKLSEILPDPPPDGAADSIATGDPEINQKLQAYREALEFEKSTRGRRVSKDIS